MVAAVAACVLLSAGGLIGALWVRSPAQIAAETRPPVPSLLTAPVSRQVITQTLVTRGTVTPPMQVEATPESESGAQRLVITAIDRPVGSRVMPGSLLAVISGRPLFALAGRFPAWRDLRPGDTGPDVAELQAALGALGYSDGTDSSGFYGPGTKAAVAGFYRSIGFSPVMAGAASGELAAAQRSVAAAQQAVSGDEEAAKEGGAKGAAARTLLPADEQRLSAAQQQYAAMAGQSGPEVPMSEVVFVPSFPATVAAFGGEVGSLVTPPLVTLDVGDPDVSAALDPADKGVLRAGEAASVTDNATGWRDGGVVSAVGQITAAGQPAAGQPAGAGIGAGNGVSENPPAASGASGPYVPVVVRLAHAVPAGELGQDVELVITYATTAHPVLAVPEAAVRTTASGTTYVLVAAGAAKQVRVRVATGLSGDGMVTVTPVGGGTLVAGEQVVTGV